MPIYKNVQRLVTFQSLTTAGAANTGTTPACTVSLDGGTAASCTNSPSHVGNGNWKITLTASEMNADQVTLVATAASCVPAQREFYPEADYTSTVAGRIDAAITSRMATFTLPTNFSSLSITGSGEVALSSTSRDAVASAVWGATTRTLSAFGFSVTVATNNDKTGYSLTQSFPANFASLAITAGGAVTAGTVSDKTGYSLSQAFPSNFASLAITGGGAVTAGTVSDKTGYSLSSAGLDSIVVETSVNARQAISIIAAACAGVASGLDGSTAVFKAVGPTGTATTRISATVDANGNRSATTLTLPS